MARGLSSSLHSTMVLTPLLAGTLLVPSPINCKPHSASHAFSSTLTPGRIISQSRSLLLETSQLLHSVVLILPCAMSTLAFGCLFWLLARMVLQMRGTILPGHKWEVMVDLFFYRDPEEAKDQEEEEAAVGPEYAAVEYTAAPTG
uniref:Uncharacterized protein n=1 Tax=Oryza brachyantha TaxID=4533 RepID=J3LPL1_ORYBR